MHNVMDVGVIIPYNVDRGYLRDAVESVKRQTYPSSKIHLVQVQGNTTATANFNTGLMALKHCDLIRYLCEDDILTAPSIAATVEYYEQHPEVDFTHGSALNFWPNNQQEIWDPELTHPTLEQMLINNRIHGGTVVYRNRCFFNDEGENLMNEELWTGEEYEFNMRLMAQGFKLGYVDAALYRYRRHDKQKSLGNMAREYQNKRRLAIAEIRESIKKRMK